ncbi:hypothetical protein Lfu02_67440 [Longispora fulva]|uniref:Uncharacterized protein n=1 Tax=Longispora fulva TaxID=619741 RepID=A0A8J7KRH1_9ACTN|nr:hypothetical protein [Longispora fulva]MBG6138522.1 hypothetical protein [Longispora fulva]GIG62372.1 hypothetical protein Lfu02_67440 [Longispora fulva]
MPRPTGHRVTADDAPVQFAGWVWFAHDGRYRPAGADVESLYVDKSTGVERVSFSEIEPLIGPDLYDVKLARHESKDENFLVVEGTRYLVDDDLFDRLGLDRNKLETTSEEDLLAMPQGEDILL